MRLHKFSTCVVDFHVLVMRILKSISVPLMPSVRTAEEVWRELAVLASCLVGWYPTMGLRLRKESYAS